MRQYTNISSFSQENQKGDVETILNRKPPRGPTQPLRKSLQQKRQQVCTHSRQAYPAKDVSCHKSNKKGHYSSMCYVRKVCCNYSYQ